MDYMTIVYLSTVNLVQPNGTNTVLLVMLPNVTNVPKTEISLIVNVLTDILKLTENVNFVTTIVLIVMLQPEPVLNV